jgi:hypothetical protein
MDPVRDVRVNNIEIRGDGKAPLERKISRE